MPEIPPPQWPELITAHWLTQSLRAGGVLSGGAVSSFEITPLAGAASNTFRITLEYRPEEPGAPSSVITKHLPQGSVQGRTLMRAFRNELRFYREMRALVRVRVPRLFYGTLDEAERRGVMMLEDIARYGRLQFDPESDHTAQAVFVAGQLAWMQASWWENSALADLDWAIGDDLLGTDYQNLYGLAWDNFREIGRELIPPGFLPHGELLRSRIADIKAYLQKPPRTILHGDFHAGNMLADHPKRPNELVLLDWQVVGKGRGVRDLAYFLSYSLPTESRRKLEQTAVAVYHRRLSEYGVEGYSLDQCWKDYRIAMLDIFYFLVAGIGPVLDFYSSDKPNDAFVFLAERILATLLDNDAGVVLSEF